MSILSSIIVLALVEWGPSTLNRQAIMCITEQLVNAFLAEDKKRFVTVFEHAVTKQYAMLVFATQLWVRLEGFRNVK